MDLLPKLTHPLKSKVANIRLKLGSSILTASPHHKPVMPTASYYTTSPQLSIANQINTSK